MAHAAGPAPHERRLVIDNGTLEALKWLALLLMTLDHINTILYDRTLPYAYQAGRIVMPLFAFVLAYNLARPGAVTSGAHGRTMRRLLLYGLLATPPFALLIGRQLPLNILFTLLVAAALIHLVDRDGAARVVAAIALFAVGGALVEFAWYGLMVCLLAWAHCRWPSALTVITLAGAMASLVLVNENFWALGALPLVLAAPHLHLRVPRLKHFFYVYYPAHLAVLWVMRHP